MIFVLSSVPRVMNIFSILLSAMSEILQVDAGKGQSLYQDGWAQCQVLTLTATAGKSISSCNYARISVSWISIQRISVWSLSIWGKGVVGAASIVMYDRDRKGACEKRTTCKE